MDENFAQPYVDPSQRPPSSDWDSSGSEEEEETVPLPIPGAPEEMRPEQRYVWDNRPTTARQMQLVDEYRKKKCLFWRFFDASEVAFKNDHLRQNYLMFEKNLEGPGNERSRKHFSEGRKAVVERILQEDDMVAKDFLEFAFMVALRPMYDHFARTPGAQVSNQARLAQWWERLSLRTEHLLSGLYGNAEYPLTEKLKAWVREMRADLLLYMGPPMPSPQEIEQRIANMHQDHKKHRQAGASRQMSMLLQQPRGGT